MKNKYAIALSYPKTFDELIRRIIKWRTIRSSVYDVANSIRPYHSIGYNVVTNEVNNATYEIETNDYYSLVSSTLQALGIIGSYYEKYSLYKAVYCGKETMTAISTASPLENEAAENLVFDLENLKSGVTQILKSYGQWNATEQLWIMDSRLAAFKALDLIINEYPIFPQLISNFEYPSEELVTQVSYTADNPILKDVWGFFRLEPNENYDPETDTEDNKFITLITTPEFDEETDTSGEFKILYYDNNSSNDNGTEVEILNLVPKSNEHTSISNVVDENSYNAWLYKDLES